MNTYAPLGKNENSSPSRRNEQGSATKQMTDGEQVLKAGNPPPSSRPGIGAVPDTPQNRLIQLLSGKGNTSIQARKSQEMGQSSSLSNESRKEKSSVLGQTTFQKTTSAIAEKMPSDTRLKMEGAFGTDFSKVNIHTNDNRATQMGALAFTEGNHIHFAPGQYAPQSSKGQELLGHELTHVIQQKQGRVPVTTQAMGLSINDDALLEREADRLGAKAAKGETCTVGNKNTMNSTATAVIQQKDHVIQRLEVDDVAHEMNGQQFVLVADNGGVAAGTVVTVTDWKGTAPEAIVSFTNAAGVPESATVGKSSLSPLYSAVGGVHKYEVGLEAQRGTVGRSQGELDKWRARESEYKNNRSMWEAELQRLEGLHRTREVHMNRMLVRETMYNRFDADIVRWVDHYNNELRPATNLEYNVVKSILFKETRMGTHGEHLTLPPYSFQGEEGTNHPIKSRFNLGQVIDSFGPQQYLMIKEMAPTIYNQYGFGQFEARSAWLDTDWWSNDNYHRAIQAFSALRQADGNNLMGNDTDLFLDYAFWIRATVRWLFRKYAVTNDWPAAIRAYNGGGSRATAYRNEVMGRANTSGTVMVGNQ